MQPGVPPQHSCVALCLFEQSLSTVHLKHGVSGSWFHSHYSFVGLQGYHVQASWLWSSADCKTRAAEAESVSFRGNNMETAWLSLEGNTIIQQRLEGHESRSSCKLDARRKSVRSAVGRELRELLFGYCIGFVFFVVFPCFPILSEHVPSAVMIDTKKKLFSFVFIIFHLFSWSLVVESLIVAQVGERELQP